MKTKITTGVYQYLMSTGALHGTQEEIIAAKKQYWNLRKLESKMRKKKTETSFTVSYNTKDELPLIKIAAKYERISPTRLIREACLLYIRIILRLSEQGDK